MGEIKSHNIARDAISRLKARLKLLAAGKAGYTEYVSNDQPNVNSLLCTADPSRPIRPHALPSSARAFYRRGAHEERRARVTDEGRASSPSMIDENSEHIKACVPDGGVFRLQKRDAVLEAGRGPNNTFTRFPRLPPGSAASDDNSLIARYCLHRSPVHSVTIFLSPLSTALNVPAPQRDVIE